MGPVVSSLISKGLGLFSYKFTQFAGSEIEK